MERLHHPLELPHLLAVRTRRGIARVRREIADRRVAPVVREAAVDEDLLVGDLVHGEELDGRDPEVAQVADRCLGGEARIGAAEVVANPRQLLREALHVELVDDGLRPGAVERPVALPVERPVDDDAPRDRG
jgi:hypothetical protein